MTIAHPSLLMMAISNPSLPQMSRSLKSSLRGYLQHPIQFSLSWNAFSTQVVRNQSFHSLVFQNQFQNTNPFNLILPCPHQAYNSIMSTLHFLKFASPNSAPTSGWRTWIWLFSTTATTAPTILSSVVTSFNNSASLSISHKTKFRASTSPYLSFNKIRNLLQNQLSCKISSMILFLRQLQPTSHTTKHIS